jgi:hypothetical protein
LRALARNYISDYIPTHVFEFYRNDSMMKLLNPKEVKEALQKFKEFDPSTVESRIEKLIDDNIHLVRNGNRNNFQYNPYLRSYLLILMHKKFVIFGIEKSGFETESSAKKDAIKTLRDIQKDKLPDYSVKRIVLELNRLDAGMARIRSGQEKRLKEYDDQDDAGF